MIRHDAPLGPRPSHPRLAWPPTSASMSLGLKRDEEASSAPAEEEFYSTEVKGQTMSTLGWIILIIVLILLFGGGGGYYWSRKGR